MLHVLLILLIKRPPLNLLRDLVLEHGLENGVVARRFVVGLDASSVVEVVERVGGDLSAPVAVPRREDRVWLVLLLLGRERSAEPNHRREATRLTVRTSPGGTIQKSARKVISPFQPSLPFLALLVFSTISVSLLSSSISYSILPTRAQAFHSSSFSSSLEGMLFLLLHSIV